MERTITVKLTVSDWNHIFNLLKMDRDSALEALESEDSSDPHSVYRYRIDIANQIMNNVVNYDK